jgi:hypothetical protein
MQLKNITQKNKARILCAPISNTIRDLLHHLLAAYLEADLML